ncbi:MAG: hypothetical protein KDE33_23125 [Bacteroidetes bacterium]|nr:hypothetical protein [Bacteroidota bacterium]
MNTKRKTIAYYTIFIAVIVIGFVSTVIFYDSKVDKYLTVYPLLTAQDTLNCVVVNVSTDYSYRNKNYVGVGTTCGNYSISVIRSLYDNDSVEYYISDNVKINYRLRKNRGSDTIYVDKGNRVIGYILRPND